MRVWFSNFEFFFVVVKNLRLWFSLRLCFYEFGILKIELMFIYFWQLYLNSRTEVSKKKKKAAQRGPTRSASCDELNDCVVYFLHAVLPLLWLLFRQEMMPIGGYIVVWASALVYSWYVYLHMLHVLSICLPMPVTFNFGIYIYFFWCISDRWRWRLLCCWKQMARGG